MKCIEAGVMSSFPMSNTSRNHQLYHSSEEIDIYCHCRQPYRENFLWFSVTSAWTGFIVVVKECQELLKRIHVSFVKTVNQEKELLVTYSS